MAAFIFYHMCNCQKYGGRPIWENCNVRSVRGIMPIWFYFKFVDSYSLPRPMPVMMLAWPYSALVTPMYILVQLPFIIERSAKNPGFFGVEIQLYWLRGAALYRVWPLQTHHRSSVNVLVILDSAFAVRAHAGASHGPGSLWLNLLVG